MKAALALLLLAGGIRLLMFYGDFHLLLENRIELNTPITSLDRGKLVISRYLYFC